jgi:hypothetical protein
MRRTKIKRLEGLRDCLIISLVPLRSSLGGVPSTELKKSEDKETGEPS